MSAYVTMCKVMNTLKANPEFRIIHSTGYVVIIINRNGRTSYTEGTSW